MCLCTMLDIRDVKMHAEISSNGQLVPPNEYLLSHVSQPAQANNIPAPPRTGDHTIHVVGRTGFLESILNVTYTRKPPLTLNLLPCGET